MKLSVSMGLQIGGNLTGGSSFPASFMRAQASAWDGSAISTDLGDFVAGADSAPTVSGDRLVFNGVDQALTLTTAIDLAGKTVVAVFRPLSTPAIAAQDSAICFYETGSHYAQYEARGANVWEQRHRHAATGISGTTMDTVTLGNARVDVTDTDTVVMAVYEGGRAVVTSGNTASAHLDITTSALGFTEIRIGKNRTGAFTAMEFVELVVFDSVVPAGVRPGLADLGSRHSVAVPNFTQFIEKDLFAIGNSIDVGVGDGGSNGYIYRSGAAVLADNVDRTTGALASAQMSPYGLTSPADDAIIAACASNITGTATYDTQSLLTLHHGTNDFNNDVPIGAITDSTDQTFYGAANIALNNMVAENPTAQIILINSPHRTGETVTNAAGHTLEDYRVALRALGVRHNITVVEMGALWNDATNATYTTDGLHPNAAGHQLMADQLVTALEGAILVPDVVPLPVAPVAAGGLADLSLTQGVAMTPLDVSADFTGDAITYALAPSSAALPAGLTLSSAGVLSGTPTATVTGASIVVRGTNVTGFDDTAFALTVAAAAAAVVSFDSFTATVEGASSTGTYELGEPWINGGGSSMTLTAMTPDAGTADRTLEDATVVTGTNVNGAMLNPGNAAEYNAGDMSTVALRQAANWGNNVGDPGQGYDSLVQTNNLAYDGSLNVTLPLTISEGTIVKAASDLSDINNQIRPALDRLAPFTFITTAPASGDFRPPHSVADKTPVLNASEIDMSRVLNQDATGLAIPTAASVLPKLRFVSWQHTYNVLSRNIQVTEGDPPVYGGDRYDYTEAMLAIQYDAWTASEKLDVAKHLIQMAIDIAGRIYEGGIWQDNGGHPPGVYELVAFAYRLTDNSYLLGALNMLVQATIPSSKPSPIGVSVFGGIAQTFTITQPIIDEARTIPYTQDQLGHPEWGGDAARDPTSALENHLSLGAVEWNVDGDGYRKIIPKCSVPGALALRMMGFDVTTQQVWFDYMDRYMGVYISVLPDNLDGKTNNNLTPWVLDAWQNDRAGLGGVWTAGTTQATALTEAPYDGYIFDVGQSNPATADMVIRGVGTTGDSIDVYAEATQGGTDTAVQTVTVDAQGNWEATFTVAQAGWDQWYRPRWRDDGGAYNSGTNLIGLGHNVMVFGQSELAYFMKPGGFNQKTPKTYLPAEDLMMLVDDADDASAITAIRATAANYAATGGNAAITTGVLAAFCAINAGTSVKRKWGYVDAVEPGTGPDALFSDANTDRSWTPLQTIVDLVRQGGSDIGLVIMNWVNNPATSLPNMLENWSPWMLGQLASGAAWTLGTPNSEDTQDTVTVYDHCLWDVEVATSERGRGLFSRDRTKLHIMGPLPFVGTGATEDFQYDNTLRVSRPAREGIEAFVADSRVQTLLQGYGPSTHISDFDGGIHPLTDDDWGTPQFATMNLVAPSLELAGVSVLEPVTTGATVNTAGDVITIAVSNKGDGMSTGRKDASGAAPSPLPPHWQPVIGVEMTLNGTRRPIWNSTAVAADSVSYDPAWEGTVDFNGSGDIEVTLVTPLIDTDVVEMHFMEGQGSAVLLEPRDVTADLHLDMPYATQTALVDASADFEFKGVPLKPQPASGTLSVDTSGISAAAPYLIKGADSYFVDPSTAGSGITRVVNRGTFNFPTTPAGDATLFGQESQCNDLYIDDGGGVFLQVRVEELNNSTPVLGPVRVQQSGVDYAVPNNTDLEIVFDTNWATGTVDVSINGVAMDQLTFTSAAGAAENGREFSIGAWTSGSRQLPTGTRMSGLSIETNGTLHKAISDTAATANADAWKRGVDDFTQG